MKTRSLTQAKTRPIGPVERSILFIRGHKVMLDFDLAKLYGVSTGALNQAIRRNADRFPEDFMFQLSWEETKRFSRSQFVILNRGHNIKYRPLAFTEQGVAMLSSVLRSRRAVQVNIEIMRVFVRLRAFLRSHDALARKLRNLENRYDAKFRIVFDAIRELMEPDPAPPRERIGFRR